MSEPRRITARVAEKAPPGSGLSLGPSCGLADEGGNETPSHEVGVYVGNPTRRVEKGPAMRAGLSLVDGKPITIGP
jgi:hypothetical protein